MIPLRDLLDRVVALTGGDRSLAGRACRAVVESLGRGLSDRAVVSAALPPELKVVLGGDEPASADLTADRLYREVATALDVPTGRALEVSQVVCESLAALWPEGDPGVLTSQLPDDVAALITPPPITDSVPRSDGRHTLATGKAGGAHPISTSRPHRSHRHSIAEGNPHGEIKISSGRVHDSPGQAHER